MPTETTIKSSIAIAETRFIPRDQSFGVYFGISEDAFDGNHYENLERVKRVLNKTPEGDNAKFPTSKEAEAYAEDILSKIYEEYVAEQIRIDETKKLRSEQPYNLRRFSLDVDSEGARVI